MGFGGPKGSVEKHAKKNVQASYYAAKFAELLGKGGGIPVECQVGTLLDGDGKFV